MKSIFLYWLSFFVVFFGVILLGYQYSFDRNLVITLMLVLYYGFQSYSIYRGFHYGRKWFIGSIIVQALFAVASPLYFSNFGDPVYEYVTGTWFDSSNSFEPCQLCWWARIMMFPILPLMITYAITQSRGILWYVYLITITGILLELFHYVLQKPYLIGKLTIENPFGCTEANPCAAIDVNYFNVLTIPFMAFLAFLFIHIAVAFLLFSKKVVYKRKGI